MLLQLSSLNIILLWRSQEQLIRLIFRNTSNNLQELSLLQQSVSIQNNYKMTLKLSVKNQIKNIFQSICYRAFGEHIEANVKLNGNSQYEVSIARDLYQSYAQNNFRYCTEGTTPKILAEQMEIHLFRQQQLITQINEFGVFVVKLHKNYKDKLLKTIQTEQQYKLISLQQLALNARKAFQPNNYKFIYNFRPKMFLRDFRLLYYTECIAKIKQSIQFHNVDRILLRQNAKDFLMHQIFKQTTNVKVNPQKLLEQAKIFVNSQQSKEKLQQINNKSYCNYIGIRNCLINTHSTQLLDQRQYRTNCSHNIYLHPENHYLACQRQMQTHFQVQYPHIKLIKVGNIEENHLINWQKANQLRKYNPIFLMAKPEQFIGKQLIQKLLSNEHEQQELKKYQNLNLGDKVVLFGDYLSDYNFWQTYYLLKAMNKHHPGNKIVSAINNTYKKVFSL